ncbi:MAG: multifunctional CCA addition/repair protein [Methylococcales bacterium]|nr:multifunctional CCA addition/repair protein [Methylococcales bacterium]
MQTLLVGGAVRDKLLNYPVKERDWVVLGETPKTMISQGFTPVGKDFPVFLHPKTHEEYALARTERKTAAGYKGFEVHTSANITLEDDLIRRDLTINAMALTTEGQVIDPYGGQEDLKNRIFRHVSPAFSEDPVRILRVARFAARYQHLGFKLAEETRQLMQEMVIAGEVQHLVAERVWAEVHKALTEQTPAAFFETLRASDALTIIFPEIANLWGVPQPEMHHPEIDTGIHSLLALTQATQLSDKAEVRFAALVHDLGKALTPIEFLPQHRGHEQAGLPLLDSFCNRLKVPNHFKTLAMQVMRYHTHCHRAFELRPATLVDMLSELGAFKKENRLQDFLIACEADSKGRTGKENMTYSQADYIKQAAKLASTIEIKTILESGVQGAKIGEAIRRLRISTVKNYKSNYERH